MWLMDSTLERHLGVFICDKVTMSHQHIKICEGMKGLWSNVSWSYSSLSRSAHCWGLHFCSGASKLNIPHFGLILILKGQVKSRTGESEKNLQRKIWKEPRMLSVGKEASGWLLLRFCMIWRADPMRGCCRVEILFPNLKELILLKQNVLNQETCWFSCI